MHKEREVISYVDPELAKKYRKDEKPKKKLSKAEEKELKRLDEESKKGISRNSLRNMGMASALGRDERMFQLRVAIERKEVQTVQASAKRMNVTDATIRGYLRDMNIGIYDAKKDDYLRFNDDTKIYEFDFDAI